MGKVDAGKFACEACGKAYPWRAQLAGKRAKCTCGAVLVVPEAEPQEVEDGGLYDLLEPAPQAIAAPPMIPADPPPVTRLGYQSRAEEVERASKLASRLTDPARDLYVPVGLLAAAFIGLMIWAVVGVGASAAEGAAILLPYVGGLTLVKTILLTGLALMFAPQLGLSFGTFWMGVLKFAAILIFTDVALLWVEEIMRATGGISASGRAPRGTLLIMLLAAVAVISTLCHYLFSMDSDEVKIIAMPLAVVSFGANIVINVILGAILTAASAPPTPVPATPAPAPAGSTAASSPAAPGVPAAPAQPVHPQDQAVLARLKNKVFIQEAKQYRQLISKPQRRLLDDLYSAGVMRVIYDLEGGNPSEPGRAYVELPPDPAARVACIEAYHKYCSARNIPVEQEPFKDEGQRFATFELSAP